MVAHVVVAGLEDVQERAVASALIAVEQGLHGLRLSPAAIHERAVAVAAVLQILTQETVEHALAGGGIEAALRFHLYQAPRLRAAAHNGLPTIGGTDHTQVFPLLQQIFSTVCVDSLEGPRAGLRALGQREVAGIEVLARIDILETIVAVAGILCLPLLGRHIGIGPHHHGCLVGERGIGHHQCVLLVGAHSNAIGLTGFHAGKCRRQRQQDGPHEQQQPTTTDFHPTFTIFHRLFSFIHLVSLLQSYEKHANPANNTRKVSSLFSYTTMQHNGYQ